VLRGAGLGARATCEDHGSSPTWRTSGDEQCTASSSQRAAARTTIAAAGLPKNARVEIDAVAIGRD
jgi:enamine deaminase RidA (YjgF/YER057c/UK114 family)